MGSCSASSGLLKAWFSWLKGSFVLRLVGLPTALLLVHLEIFGSSPVATSLILNRLARRLRLSSIACMLHKEDADGVSTIFVVGGADVMHRAQSRRNPKLASTPDNKGRTQPSALGGVFPPPPPPPPPQRLHNPRPPHLDTAFTTPSTLSQDTTLSNPSSPSPSPSPSPLSSTPASSTPTPPPPAASTPAPSSPAPPAPAVPSTPAARSTHAPPVTVPTAPTPRSDPAPSTAPPTVPSTPAPAPAPAAVPSTPAPTPAAVPSTPAPAPAPIPSTPAPARVPSTPARGRVPSTPAPLARVHTTPAPRTSATVPSTPAPASAMPSHTRSASSADIVRQGKRLSLQFPIQPASGNGSPMFSPRSRPQSMIATPSSVPSPDTASVAEINILAVIAAQERYVLELKEELAKAEQDLKMLKGYHAAQESTRQLHAARKVTQLQPLDTSLANFAPSPDDEDGSSSWMMREMERRKALLSSTKSSQRKVFSGSRHLRTLSLLSPDKNYTPSFPQPLDVLEQSTPSGAMRPPPLSRASTTPDIASQMATNANGEKYDIGGLTNMQRDALLRTGKRMATDFKDGLLTFIEDIRQATVGEDAMGDGIAGSSGKGPAAKGTRKPSDGRPPLQRSTSSKKSHPQRTEDIGDDFWRQHGLSEPKTSAANKKTHASKQISTPQKQPASAAEDFEDWDSWDTPNDKHAHGASNEDVERSSDESEEPSSPISHQASSRTSTSSAGIPEDMIPRDSKRNSIPWPDLVKLSPTNLKRTASHLMKEWEKNLTPPPESRDASHASGDYIGRAVSPE